MDSVLAGGCPERDGGVGAGQGQAYSRSQDDDDDADDDVDKEYEDRQDNIRLGGICGFGQTTDARITIVRGFKKNYLPSYLLNI